MLVSVVFFAITLQNGVPYEILAPDDYFNYYRSEDSPIKSPEKKFGNIKYTDLLSIIHDEGSNRALLDRINEYDELDAVLNNREINENDNETVIVETVAEDPVIDIKDSNLVLTEDADTLKENDGLFDEDKPILDQTEDILNEQEISRRQNEIIANKEVLFDGETIILDPDRPNEGYNIPIFDKTLKQIEPKRVSKRSVLKVLRSFVHKETTPKPKKEEKQENRLGQAPEINIYNSLEKLIENLTESITHLNKYLAALKSQARDDKGYVLIKIPLNETVASKFNPVQTMNPASESDLVRTKRDLDDHDNIFDTNLNNNDSSNSNVTRKGADILSTTENILSSIISDSETANKGDTKEVIKIKRDVNVSGSDFTVEPRTFVENENNITNNNSDYANLNNDTRSVTDTTNNGVNKTDNDDSNKSSEKDIRDREIPNETTTDSTDIVEAKVNNRTDNNTKILDALLNGRRSLDNREEMLDFIDQTYGDIKTLISPIASIRDKFSENVVYKIGYIIANLETMDASLNKLKEKMYLQGDWENNRLQKVLRKLYMSKKLVVNIMEYLNKYTVEQAGFVK